MFSHIKGIQIILFLKWKIVKSPNFNTKEMVQWPMTHIHPPDTQEAAIIGMFMKTVNVQVWQTTIYITCYICQAFNINLI